MARDFPNETAPAGKPGISSRQSVTSKGSAWSRGTNSTEYKQETFGAGGKSGKAAYDQKGKAWSREQNGPEYGCKC